MARRASTRSWVVVALAVFVLVACSSAADNGVGAVPTSAVEPATASTSTTPSSSEAPQSSTTTIAPGDGADPARPGAQGPGEPDENPTWLGRGAMSAASIELPWSTGEEAVEVAIHRFDAGEATDVATMTLTQDTVVWSGDASPFVDTALTAGAKYVYVLEATIDGVTHRRFTEAHAVDDTVPPDPVDDLRLTMTADEVALEWSPSSDDYEFARYAIRRSIDGEASVYYGTGWTVDQTSFVDDQLPATGSISYEVFAVDFHGNVSAVRTVSTTR